MKVGLTKGCYQGGVSIISIYPGFAFYRRRTVSGYRLGVCLNMEDGSC